MLPHLGGKLCYPTSASHDLRGVIHPKTCWAQHGMYAVTCITTTTQPCTRYNCCSNLDHMNFHAWSLYHHMDANLYELVYVGTHATLHRLPQLRLLGPSAAAGTNLDAVDFGYLAPCVYQYATPRIIRTSVILLQQVHHASLQRHDKTPCCSTMTQ